MRILKESLESLKHLNNVPTEFPSNLLDRELATKIHSQTLERLDERGGMSISEILSNISKSRDLIEVTQYGIDQLNLMIRNNE